MSNLDVHVFRTREGAWSARATVTRKCGRQGTVWAWCHKEPGQAAKAAVQKAFKWWAQE